MCLDPFFLPCSLTSLHNCHLGECTDKNCITKLQVSETVALSNIICAPVCQNFFTEPCLNNTLTLKGNELIRLDPKNKNVCHYHYDILYVCDYHYDYVSYKVYLYGWRLTVSKTTGTSVCNIVSQFVSYNHG